MKKPTEASSAGFTLYSLFENYFRVREPKQK